MNGGSTQSMSPKFPAKPRQGWANLDLKTRQDVGPVLNRVKKSPGCTCFEVKYIFAITTDTPAYTRQDFIEFYVTNTLKNYPTPEP